MSNKFLHIMKTIAISTLALSIVVVGIISVPNVVSATEITLDSKDGQTGIQYVKFNSLNVADCFGKTAPEYDDVNEDGVGYLFGGWYEKTAENNYDPIETPTELNQVDKDNVVAKFVPAQTLSVKCQNLVGTTSGQQTSIRILSATDSKNYKAFGFEITREEVTEEGRKWKVISYSADNPAVESNEVYSRFNYYEMEDGEAVLKKTYTPSELFGKAATKFTATGVQNIPADYHDTIICIRPYWKTLDGTQVYGLSRFAHVEDGYLNYINVPVNINTLNQNNKAVAGMLNVTSVDGLQLIDENAMEYGKLFDEMDTHAVTSDGKVTVRCVGNMNEFSEANQRDTMDIFINLRFKSNIDLDELPKYTFEVTNEEFCDFNKEINHDDVWDVKY